VSDISTSVSFDEGPGLRRRCTYGDLRLADHLPLYGRGHRMPPDAGGDLLRSRATPEPVPRSGADG
jgi:hypothetical protein